MKTSWFPSQTLFFLCATLSPCLAAPIVWDNSNATSAWSTPANWDTNTEPTAADDVTFPLGLAGTITTTTTENALSLTFDDAYTLSGGTLALASGNSIHVADGVTASINNALTITGGLSKTGTGTLVLGGTNTNAGGTVISAGRIRAASTGSMGAAGAVTTVNGGTILEVANAITLDRPITLMQGGTVAGLGTATNNGKITIDAAATSITLATDQAGDVFIVGNGANDVTGGTSTTVIGLSGPGAVRLGGASDFDGSWSIPSGRLELAAAAALGDQAASSVTLSGGTLSARLATATTFTGPAANLIVTADSGLLSDRSSVSAGVTHILGTLSMGAQTLTVAPGASATSGTAGITLGNVTLTGNPVLAINDSGATNGKLTTGSILGGSARSIIKSGAGDLAVTGGVTDLPAGSTFTATGGGNIEMLFATLGGATSVAITAAQNPFGEATVSVTDGALRLLADGSGLSDTQTYQLPTTISLSGAVTLDPDRRTAAANTNKTFELSGLSLAADTVLGMSGNNLHGVRLTGPLALSGDATLQGVALASQDGLLTLNGGISGAAGDSLTIAGGTSPLNLTIGASSTYGGGTSMSGSNVTLTAANAFGSGATALSGGSLIVNAADALVGTVTLSGGTLRVNDATFLANNSVLLQGGTLDLRNNAGASISVTSLTLSGTSTLNLANNGSGSTQAMIVPLLNVSGDSTLTLTNANGYTPTFTSLALAGSLTLNNGITARIQSISEDASARTLAKTGTGLLELEGASSHSGGTEILAGTLLVKHASALGTGDLTVGATSGTATATVQFNSGLNIANNIVIRSGSSGTATLDSPSGGVTWPGGLSLQKAVTLDVGSSASSYDGVISGTGAITKISGGELVLGNAANSFLGDIAVSAGTLTAASNGALGNAANGVNLTSSGILKISGTFSSGRTINVTGTATDVNVTSGNTLTLSAPVAGTGTFAKGDSGTLEFAPAVDASARGSALNQLNAGTLRLQGALNLGNASPLTLSGGTLELLNDANTDFAHPVTTAAATTTIHVDRAAGGVATNGRHTLGELTATTSNLTVAGANGFGLTLDGYTTTSNSSITHNAPGTLILSVLTGNPATSSRTLTVGGTGDIEVTGATTEGAGTGSYGIIKEGTGRFTFGSSVTEFNRILTVEDGVVDLNGLSYTTTGLVTLGGSASLLGAQIETEAGGSLNLGAGLTFSNSGNPAGARVTGNLGIGTIAQTFTVNDSSGATTDLTLDGPITGSLGSSISKSGIGTLRLSGAGNTLPGLFTVSAGLLELAKSSGNAIGTGGLSITGGTTRLLAAGQIDDSGAVSLSSASEVFLELNGFSETTGPVSLTQTDSNDYSAVKTGAAGTLVLNGDLTLNNNSNSSGADGREVLITGTGSETVAATDGTLDLGGATRTIHVATTTVGANETKANATIETQIVNGGILKTGPRTLFLNHPNNTFAGGLQIAEGSVKPATLASLGAGPVSFTNSGAASAGIDLGTLTGTLAGDFTIGGSGSGAVTLTYSALAPNALVLSGNFDLQRDLTVDVINGSTTVGSSATLEFSGTLSDGAATSGLTKIGNGTLKLSGTSNFEGPVTVEKGILTATSDAALGDPASTLNIDGGCFLPTATFTSTRDLVFGPSGGSVRGDSPNSWTLSGDVTWSAGTNAFFGTGTTILSGSSIGPGGDLQLGEPTAFATVPFSPIIPVGHVLSLRGSAALPAGNLSITHRAVLELGNGDFTHALGTGDGEVQLPTADGAGWAAHGANRNINLGGAAAPVIWGQTSPPFLYQNTGDFNEQGDLILGSATATHTVDFQNPIDFDNGTTYILRDLVVPNGPAALEARLSGGITQAADPETTFTLLDLEVEGALEISGPVSGEFHLAKYGAGTATIAGTNNSTGDIGVFEGTLVITSNAGTGTPRFVTIDPAAELDASALATPLVLGEGSQFYNVGIFRGDLEGPAYFDGSGLFDGDLHVMTNGYLNPGFTSMMQVVGDFTLDSGATLNFNADGIAPDTEYTRMSVAGAVTLGGFFEIYPGNLTEGSTFVFLLNDGADPISGTFDGLSEGAGIPIGNGLALQVTYLANGDGGAVGNDFGATVVPDIFSSDLSLFADAPVAVDLGAEIVINYTVDSPGPGLVNDGVLEITLPFNATFVSSTPAGTINSGVLSIPLPPLAAPDTTIVELRLTAPGVTDAVLVDAYVGSVSDSATGNNYFGTTIAVLPDGRPVLSIFTTDSVNDTLTLGIDTISGVIYELESSIELIDWMYEDTIFGDGEPFQITLPMDLDEEFFRFRIVPNNTQGGGVE